MRLESENPAGLNLNSGVQVKSPQKMAPEVGFEPTTNRLTADRSTTELLRSVVGEETNP